MGKRMRSASDAIPGLAPERRLMRWRAAQARAFDALVDTLQRMRRMGWPELEVAERPAQVGRYRRRYIGAVARCTDEGRRHP
jgi:hypothetical protein